MPSADLYPSGASPQRMWHDYHVHSNYSDGEFLVTMLRAADDAGLDGVGVADHCNVSDRDRPRLVKRAMGFNLDRTHERRREAIDHLRDQFDLAVYDAVEMDYDPRDVEAIATFLDDAGFDYSIGSVHTLEDVNVHFVDYFADRPEEDRAALVTSYFDDLVGLVESELFDVAAHLDLVERNPALRGFATEDQYRRVAEALEDSRTVPEINAGRVLDDYGEIHPSDPFVEVLLEHDIAFVLGTDSHEPVVIEGRLDELESFVEEHGVETTTLEL